MASFLLVVFKIIFIRAVDMWKYLSIVWNSIVFFKQYYLGKRPGYCGLVVIHRVFNRLCRNYAQLPVIMLLKTWWRSVDNFC